MNIFGQKENGLARTLDRAALHQTRLGVFTMIGPVIVTSHALDQWRACFATYANEGASEIVSAFQKSSPAPPGVVKIIDDNLCFHNASIDAYFIVSSATDSFGNPVNRIIAILTESETRLRKIHTPDIKHPDTFHEKGVLSARRRRRKGW